MVYQYNSIALQLHLINERYMLYCEKSLLVCHMLYVQYSCC